MTTRLLRFVNRPTAIRRIALALLALGWMSPRASAQHVHSGLPHNIPDLCANSASTVAAGETQTWSGTHSGDCVAVRGTLVLSGALTANTIMVYEGGFLDVRSGASITFRDTPLNTAVDPEQFGQGLIILGRVRMSGAEKTSHVRLAAEAVAGQSTLTLSSTPTGWAVGDRVFLPDSRNLTQAQWYDPGLTFQHETRTIAGISGSSITLNAPLSYTHRGARDADGTPTVLSSGIRLLPHVANLTRSIVVRSQNPNGTRGHVLATHRATVELRGVSLQDLGRTKAVPLDSTTLANGAVTKIGANQIGRYPVHIHHLMGPLNPTNTGYQFTLVGNAVENSLKWPMAIHGSHFGLIEGNVIVGGQRLTGSGLAFEDGSETENLVRRNFIADIRGNINPRASNPDTADGTTPGSGGECLWGAGFNNRFIDNVMAGCRNAGQGVASGVGVKLVTLSHGVRVKNPLFRGADMTDPNQTREVVVYNQPVLQFDGNEVYGLASTGMTLWLVGTNGYSWNLNQKESLIRDFKVWHTYDGAFWTYPVNKVTFERLTYRMDPAQSYAPAALTAGDYRVVDLAVRDSSIHAGSAFGWATDPLGTFRFERNRIVSRDHAFVFLTPRTPGTGADRSGLGGVTMWLSGNVVTAWPGQSLRTIRTEHTAPSTGGDTASPYVIQAVDHQGVVGDSFRPYFEVQATQNVYGGLAPSGTTTRPDVVGLVSGGISTPPPPPSTTTPPPPPPPPDEVCGDRIDNDGDGQIDEGCSTATPASGQSPDCTEGPTVTDSVGAVWTFGPNNAVLRDGVHLNGGSGIRYLYSGGSVYVLAVDGVTWWRWANGWQTVGTTKPACGTAPPPPPPTPDEVCGDEVDNDDDGQIDESCPTGSADTSVPGDFDGDSKADITVFSPATGAWRTLKSRGDLTSSSARALGQPTDRPVMADYDGDGKADLAVFGLLNGVWQVLTSSSEFKTSISRQYGAPGDIPIPADYDGDGKADFAVFRPSNGRWYVLPSMSGFTQGTSFKWGQKGDVPVPADYDGDGKADPMVFRPASGTWQVRRSAANYKIAESSFGSFLDVPAPGDYDGDGKADLAFYRDGFYVRLSGTRYATELTRLWGIKGDVPVPSDYDGDGRTDFALFRPLTRSWYVLTSSSAFARGFSVTWGESGDIAVPITITR